MPRHRHLTRVAAIAVLAAFIAAVLAACGGGSSEDPQKVLDETFAAGKDYSKGKVDIDLKVNADGDQAGSLDATIKGPYQGAAGAFPQFDFDADVNLETGGNTQGFQGGLVSSGDAAFLNFNGTDYKLDEATFKNFKALFASLQSQNKPDANGSSTLNPSTFLVDLKNEGTEDVEGAKAIHISGKVDVNKLIDQVEAAPGAKKSDAAELDQLRTSVESADADIYSGQDDKRLRKVDSNIIFTPPADQTGGKETKITLQFTLTFSDLGQDQTISAPTSSQPLSQLLQQLGQGDTGLGQALGASSGSGSGSGASADTGAAAGPSAPSKSEAGAYVQCLSQAKGEAAIQACLQYK